MKARVFAQQRPAKGSDKGIGGMSAFQETGDNPGRLVDRPGAVKRLKQGGAELRAIVWQSTEVRARVAWSKSPVAPKGGIAPSPSIENDNWSPSKEATTRETDPLKVSDDLDVGTLRSNEDVGPHGAAHTDQQLTL